MPPERLNGVDGLRLPDRFVAHGVVGRGGQATVVLATDKLRGERVALKVLHPHLAADPLVRRRLVREVHAAALLRSEAALVPYDLHEVEGSLALSMPFHPGRTVAERVGAEGPLPADDLRAIGARVARALADAHAAGIVHRDVSASNVLVGDDPRRSTVLADFGLARLAGQATMTRVGGTLGYAAPEVLAGARADARADLYGLGAVLYLAATGRTPLDAGGQAVRELRRDLPADLADTIDALLAKAPEDRPASAAEVVDALEQRVAAGRPAPAADAGARQFLAPGPFAVRLEERGADRDRRRALRRRPLGGAESPVVQEVARWGRAAVDQVRQWMGLARPEPSSPEDRLLRAVAAEAGVDPADLLPSELLYQRRFHLVDGVDRGTADRLAAAAAAAGFRAEVEQQRGWFDPQRLGLFAAVSAVLASAMLSGGDLANPARFLPFAAILLVFGGSVFRRRDQPTPAYDVHLTGALREGARATPRFASTAAPAPKAARKEAPAAATRAPSRGEALLDRARRALDELEAVTDLPDPARDDVRRTAKDLRRQAEALAAEIDRLDEAARGSGAAEHEVAALSARLTRLRTLEAAGDRQDPATLASLERALAQHEADLAAAEDVESRLAAATARLLEIASTASRVRRELLGAPAERVSVDKGLDRLHAQARAAAAARREVAR